MAMNDTLFPTALFTAMPANVVNPQKGRPAWNYTAPPGTPISPRIRDQNLLKSLQKDCSFHLKIQNVQTRPPQPPKIPPKTARLPRRGNSINYKVFHRKISQLSYDVLNGDAPLPDELGELSKIMFELQSLVDQSIHDEDYDEANRIQNCIDKCQSKYDYIKAHMVDTRQIQEDLIAHSDLETIVKLRLEEWNEQYDTFMEACKQKEQQMIEEFQQKLQEYDEGAPQAPNKSYAKESTELTNMRMKERNLALHHKFSEAKQMQRKGNRVEVQEYDVAMQKTYQDFLRKRTNMINEFEKQLQAYRDHCKATAIVLMRARQKAVEGHLKRMDNINKDVIVRCERSKVKEEHVMNDQFQETTRQRSEDVRKFEKKTSKRAGFNFTQGNAFITARQRK